MKFKSTYLALALFAGFGLALGACGGGGGGTPALTVDDVRMGDTLKPGTHPISAALADAFDDVDAATAAKLVGADFQTGATVLNVAGYDFACVVGPCSVVINDNGTITTKGTIEVVAAGGKFPTANPEPPVASACDTSMTSAECVAEKKTAMDEAKEALDAAKDDENSTQKEIADAQKAYNDAKEAYDDAVTTRNTYLAMQPPGYDLKALETAVKKQASSNPVSLGGGITVRTATDTVDGGKVKVEDGSPPANTYSMATWPVGELASFDESVWERTIPSKDSVVVYTNIQAATGAKWNVYYAAESSSAPSTGSASGRKYKAWAGVDSAAANLTTGKPNVITLDGDGITATNRSLFDIPHGLSATTRTGTFTDDAATTDVKENELKGKFNGVAGTFACTNEPCTISVDKDVKLSTLAGTWTFTPDSNATVAGVDLDADYIDFGYWMETTTVAGTDSYKAAAFYRGSDAAGDVTNVLGSATYTGGAAGLFTRKTFADDGSSSTLTSGGRFTADAELTANFGGGDVGSNDQWSISGTIDQFKDSAGKLIDPAWSLSLMTVQEANGSVTAKGTWTDAPSGAAAHFSGSTTGGGKWSGNFYGDTGTGGTTAPPHVAGQFTGVFNNGDVMGAFGATK